MRGRIGQTGLFLLLFAGCTLAADIDGIWTGRLQNQRGEPDDVAFRFKVDSGVLTGKMFGDEFDLVIADGSVTGDEVKFTVTTTNYYNKRQQKFVYSGTIKGDELELIRKRVAAPDDRPNSPFGASQTIKLKRIP